MRIRGCLRVNWMEVSGSLGDLGVFIPLVVAVCVTSGLDIGIVLILAGILNVFTGILFRQPIPVQPMKALATIVIAEGLIKEELLAAGFILGVILVLASYFIETITKYIPIVVVRGIQLGIGLKLILKGYSWIGQLPLNGLNSQITGAVILLILIIAYYKKWPLLIFIFIAGILMLHHENASTFSGYNFVLPKFQFYWPGPSHWASAFIKGAIVQFPLTLLNSVIAVCALSEDYFPGKGIKPRNMAFSVGLMNIICAPLGGIPMCHGSGGLAAQYAFGARQATSVIFLGIMKIMIGILFGGALITILKHYPMSVLGPMLMLAGFQLLKLVKYLGKDWIKIFIALLIAVCILIFNTLTGFIVGCVSSILLGQYFVRGRNK